MSDLVKCGRCDNMVSLDKADGCWWCQSPLRDPCWETVGHCGHPEAEAVNERGRKVVQP